MEAVLAAFIIILGAFVVLKRGWIDFSILPAFRILVLKITLPAFVFASFVREGSFLIPNIFLTMALGSAALYGSYILIGRLFFHWPIRRAFFLGYAGVASNSLLLGVAIFSLVFGHAIDPIVGQIILFENFFLLPSIMLVADYGEQGGLRAIGRALLHNQFLWAVGLAMVVVLSGITLPSFLINAVELVGRAAAPVALITVGGLLARTRTQGYLWPAIVAVIGKLVLLPILGLWIGRALGLSAEQLTILVLFMALPNAVNLPLFGEELDFAPLANTVFAIAYPISILTLGIWLAVMT